MLKEVTMETAVKARSKGQTPILIVNGTLMTFEEFLDGVRFLIDVEDKPKEEKPKKQRPDRHHTKDMEQEILKAWNGGERSIKEIQELTGASYYLVRKYIPISEKG